MEKYKGDALLQKTFIEDCISKRVRVNRGELPQYYIENSHEAIIDRKTWDRAQEELARRAGKRKVKEVGTKTEQGKYSAKYALTELLVCGCCGTPYRRVTWTQRGQKRIVWRCINRLDYGTKYCKKSPTLDEGAVQNAIVRAITDLALIEPMVFENLKLHMEMGLRDKPDESAAPRLRLNELNSALEELVIANTSGGADYTAEDAGCNAIEAEILTLQTRLAEIEGNQKEAQNRSEGLEKIFALAGKLQGHPVEYDEKTVRQLLECVKVVDSETLLVIFRGGIEKEVRIG